jgi:uncharacterized protein YndB with AHSA1/START domain
MAEDHIVRSLTVPAPPERAFHAFTAELARWWPVEYTWSGAVLQWIGMEPHARGACYELGPEGFRCDFGRVLHWQPPHLLRFSWQIGPTRVPEPDPAKASEVEVRFLAETPDRTRLELEHRHFSRHGSGAEVYRAAMASPQGWEHILDRYARALA